MNQPTSATTPRRPGGELATRPLHFIWIADCSGSMSGSKITALNFAIREAIPAMRKVADENPNASVFVRAIRFGSNVQWHVAQPTPLAAFNWTDLSTDGVTNMGRALSMVAEELKVPPMNERALPPVLVLISDGQPTDDFASGLKRLFEQKWGQKAVRIAIAIGDDADKDVLQRFINNPEIQPLQANNSEDLVNYIKWASTTVLQSVSAPAAQKQSSTNPTLPPPPQTSQTPTAGIPPGDVW
jgi:uncharacterized protein YegL